jgi:hypothetical protein
MSINYCQIIEPMEIYPHDLQRIIELLETVLYPKNSVDQALMVGITSFLRLEIEKHEQKLAEGFRQELSDAAWANEPHDGHYVVTWSASGEPVNEATGKTEVTVAPDFPYPEGTAENKRATKKVAKKTKKKAK